MLVDPTKWLKQIIQNKHNGVKNPKWLETNQLSIYKRRRGFELGTTVNKSNQCGQGWLELGASELKVQRSNCSAILSVVIGRFYFDIIT